MMTQTEMLDAIKKSTAEKWSELLGCEITFGYDDPSTISALHAACTLLELLENVTGKQWYYSSRDDEMKPE